MAGLLLMTIGVGLFYTNKSRITQFEKVFNDNATTLYQSEIERTELTLNEYTTVFKVIPILIILAALLMLFFHAPIWRAVSITSIAMLIVILFVDGTAYARMETYHNELKMMDMKNE